MACHRTETWFIHHRAVHCAASTRVIYPLYSYTIPRFRSQAAAELFPCSAGSGHPWIGKLPGLSLFAFHRVCFSHLGWGTRFTTAYITRHRSCPRTSDRLRNMPGRHWALCASLCSVCDILAERIRIDFLGPIYYRANLLASPVYAGEKSQATERARIV